MKYFSSREEFINHFRQEARDSSYYIDKINAFKNKENTLLDTASMSSLETYCEQKIGNLDGNIPENMERIIANSVLLQNIVKAMSYKLVVQQMDSGSPASVSSSEIYKHVQEYIGKKKLTSGQLEECCLFLGKVFENKLD